MPGWLSLAIFEALTNRPLKSSSDRLIDAALLASFDLGIYLILTKIFNELTLEFITLEKIGDITTIVGIKGASIVVLLGVSLLVGFLASIVYNTDFFMRLMRILRITRKYSSPSLWMQVFEKYGDRWVIIHLTDGKQIIGAARISSDLEEEKALMLEEVEIYKGKKLLRKSQAMYMKIDNKVEFIEFYRECL